MKEDDFLEYFAYFVHILHEHPERPLVMQNEEIAKQLFEELKKDTPEAFIITTDDDTQYISITEAAKIETAKLLEEKARTLQKLAERAEKNAQETKSKPSINGFDLLAKSYKRALKERKHTPEEAAELQANIRVFETLATFDKKDFYRAFNSGAFNDIVKGYIAIMFDAWRESEQRDTRRAAEKLTDKAAEYSGLVLEWYNAEEAETRYNTGRPLKVGNETEE